MSAPASPSVARRRLLAWKGSPDRREAPTAGPTGREARPARVPVEYSPPARPECQPALATCLPVRFSRLAFAVTVIIVLTAGAILPALWPAPVDAILRGAGPRFTRSTAIVGELLDPRGPGFAAWLAEIFLLSAAAVALAIRGMRRHRRDGRHGRARAWGAMTMLLALAAASDRLRLGELLATVISDATGMLLGPDGAGWWVAVAGSASVLVTLWAILPLHDRVGPMIWCLFGLGGWAFAAAMPWLQATPWGGAVPVPPAVVAASAWLGGSAALLVAMLVTARGVIREIRGACTARVGTPVTTPAAAVRSVPHADTRPRAEESVPETAEDTEEEATPTADDTRYTDGSDLEDDYASRPLSKAEKKRLRRLARTGQAA